MDFINHIHDFCHKYTQQKSFTGLRHQNVFSILHPHFKKIDFLKVLLT